MFDHAQRLVGRALLHLLRLAGIGVDKHRSGFERALMFFQLGIQCMGRQLAQRRVVAVQRAHQGVGRQQGLQLRLGAFRLHR